MIRLFLGMWNSSPLMIATQYSKMEIAHYLMSRPNLRIDHVNDKGVTALLLACSGECLMGHFHVPTIDSMTYVSFS